MPGKSKGIPEPRDDHGLRAGQRFAFDALDPKGAVVPSDFALTPAEGGTRLRRTMSMSTPSGLQGVLWPVIFPALVKPAIQKQPRHAQGCRRVDTPLSNRTGKGSRGSRQHAGRP